MTTTKNAMVNEPKIGAVQACDAREYGRISGFVVEEFSYWNGAAEPYWAVPAWEERGLADLAGVFETVAAAHAAIARALGQVKLAIGFRDERKRGL